MELLAYLPVSTVDKKTKEFSKVSILTIVSLLSIINS